MMVFEDEPLSLAVLCARRTLTPGIYPLVNFVPVSGNSSQAVELDKQPAITVFQPLSTPQVAVRDPIDGGQRSVASRHVGHD